MKKYLYNLIKFFSFPLFVLIVIIFLYVKSDPFQDFGNYDNYSWKYHFQQLGDLSTKKLLNSKTNYMEKELDYLYTNNFDTFEFTIIIIINLIMISLVFDYYHYNITTIFEL